MAQVGDIGAPCLSCDKCSGFVKHEWRTDCQSCRCSVLKHKISEITLDYPDDFDISNDLTLERINEAKKNALKFNLIWFPLLSNEKITKKFLDANIIPSNHENFAIDRSRKIRFQCPTHDLKPAFTLTTKGRTLDQKVFEAEQREARRFKISRDKRDLGFGYIDETSSSDSLLCHYCSQTFIRNTFCIRVRIDHQAFCNSMNSTMSIECPKNPAWHLKCFKCTTCDEILVDYIYCWSNGRPYCLRHYGELIRPRCATCDHLIFSEEYTRAMDQEHHTGHFACKTCDSSLTGQRYILREDAPHCLVCYESRFANTCEHCNKKISCDSKDLSFKERHWHESCFRCSSCEISLAEKPFATKDEQLFCSECYDDHFAPRCDGCTKVFKAGMKKYEYRNQKWHEECFSCNECKQPIGSKSFIPRENQAVCVPCYETKYAQHCTKCSDVIRRGGVTYKGNPWHKECFCCTSCNKQLAGSKFTSKDEKPYCAECYGELFAKKCNRCMKPITGFGGCKFISFEDKHWHSECFACHRCSVNLVGRGFLTNENQILCSDCGR